MSRCGPRRDRRRRRGRIPCVAALEERVPLSGEAFEFDRSNFGAVLFLLRPFVLVFVLVEFARYAFSGAVEEVHRRPQEIVEVGFETGFAERRDKGVEDVGQRASHGGLIGQGARVGLVLVRTAAVELQFVEEMAGGGRGVSGLEVGWVGERHGRSACCGRAHRGLCGDPFAAGRLDPHREARLNGRSGAQDGGRRLFCLAMQSRPISRHASRRGAAGGGKQLPAAVAGPGGLPPLDRPLKGRGRALGGLAGPRPRSEG